MERYSHGHCGDRPGAAEFQSPGPFYYQCRHWLNDVRCCAGAQTGRLQTHRGGAQSPLHRPGGAIYPLAGLYVFAHVDFKAAALHCIGDDACGRLPRRKSFQHNYLSGQRQLRCFREHDSRLHGSRNFYDPV